MILPQDFPGIVYMEYTIERNVDTESRGPLLDLEPPTLTLRVAMGLMPTVTVVVRDLPGARVEGAMIAAVKAFRESFSK